MTFQVLAQADRSRIQLLPQSGDKVLFEGHLRLKDMPQGPRVFKFLVKKENEAERYLPPEDAMRLLRKAGDYLVRGTRLWKKVHGAIGSTGCSAARPRSAAIVWAEG